MKNIFYLGLITGLLFVSCKETVVQNPTQNGSLYIDSKPQGAKIFLQGTFTNQYTPAKINNLAPDNYDIRVEVEPGVDSSFILEVKSSLTTSATIDFSEKTGKCYFQSTPPGAEIFLDNLNTSLTTPSRVNYLKTGMHHYKLLLDNYVIEDSVYISSPQLVNVYKNFLLLLPKGSMFLDSSPQGAQIWVSGTNYGKVTPDSIVQLIPGDYSVELILDGYRDTSFTVTVIGNQQTTKQVTLVYMWSTYGPVRIYETAASTFPNGLDLSTGSVYGVSSADKDKIDIYYSTTGTGGSPFQIQSADLYNNLTRETFFHIGNGTDINDGTDSPIYPLSGWTNNMGDRETNYVFLYDQDGYYTKLIITGWGGGTVGNPSWIEVKWLYNDRGADYRF